MLSIDNTYDRDEVLAWHKRVLKELDLAADESVDYVCEPKVDGMAVSLRYEEGSLLGAVLRAAMVSAATTSRKTSARFGRFRYGWNQQG